MMNEDLHALFHKLWTKDVGTEGYNKKDWMRLEGMILDLQSKKDFMRLTEIHEELRAGGGTVTRRSDTAKAVGSIPTQPTFNLSNLIRRLDAAE